MCVRAAFVRGVRRLISRLATPQSTTQSSQIAGVWGNLSDFALTPTIPGLCSCNRRRESAPDGRIGSRSQLEPALRRCTTAQVGHALQTQSLRSFGPSPSENARRTQRVMQ